MVAKNKSVRRPFCFVSSVGKAIPSRLLDTYARKSEKAESKSREDESMLGGLYAKGLVEPLYSPLSLAQLLELNTYHMRACKTKARDTAGLGWFLQPTTTKADKKNRDKIEVGLLALNPPLQVTLDRSCNDFESIGYGCVEIVKAGYRHNGELVGINHINATNVRVHRKRQKYCQVVSAKTRWFKDVALERDVHQDTGLIKPLNSIASAERATEMVWWYNYSPRSIYYGLPDVLPSLGAIYGDISRRDYNIAFFDNYGVPAYAVFVTGNFEDGPEDANTGLTPMETTIQEHFKEVAQNPHSVLVLTVPSAGEGEVKIEFVPLAKEVKEASFRLYRMDNRDEILAAHAVPPYRCGIAETGSLGGTTAEETNKIYKASVIEPRQSIIEGWFNKYIIQGCFGVSDWRWKLVDLDVEDANAEMTNAQTLFNMGALTPNDIIRYFGDKYNVEPAEGDEAMDAHYINGQPIGVTPAVQEEEVMASLQSMKSKLADILERAVKERDEHVG